MNTYKITCKKTGLQPVEKFTVHGRLIDLTHFIHTNSLTLLHYAKSDYKDKKENAQKYFNTPFGGEYFVEPRKD